MKKTRKALVEIILSNYPKEYFKNATFKAEVIADYLIKEGWITLDKPREYWIVSDGYFRNTSCSVFETEQKAEESIIGPHPERFTIIHVKEIDE